MEVSNQQEMLEKAARLYEVVGKRKELAREEAELKGFFKERYPDGAVVRCGSYAVSITPDLKETIDRAALEQSFGVEAVKRFLKESPYYRVQVREDRRMSLQRAL